MTAPVNIQVSYHKGQNELFFKSSARKRVITKGRRWGFTRGAAQFVIETMLGGIGPCMWGDTVLPNIDRYVERYFMPVLKQLPENLWDWQKQAKILRIGDQVCDFRSADKPENWEGFGYKLIVLNEAGIILKNQYLWHNAVRPMLMDHPDSVAIIGGTPKGKGLFYELWKMGEDHNQGWESFKYASYANPFLSKAEIDDLILDLPEGVVKQEIYAEFAEVGENTLIPYDLILACMKRIPVTYPHKIEVWSLDVARQGDDTSVLAKRNDKRLYELKGVQIPDTMKLASWVNYQFAEAEVKPIRINIEVTGIGWGVFDRCREYGLPVFACDVSTAATKINTLNMRAEMYLNLLAEMKKDLCLPNDRRLLRQLANVLYEMKGNDIKLVVKEKIKKEIGESPDYADAVALSFYEPITLAHNLQQIISMQSKSDQAAPWDASKKQG